MKIGVMTGIKELDNLLQNTIKQVSVGYYTDFFFQDEDIKIAIISPAANIDISFSDFLYKLREYNIRVIVLLPDANNKYISDILSLGITDILFDPIDIEKIVSVIKYPMPFSDVAKYYVKGKVYTPNTECNANTDTESKKSINDAKKQIISLFNFFGKNVDNSLSLLELLALLESEIIKKKI